MTMKRMQIKEFSSLYEQNANGNENMFMITSSHTDQCIASSPKKVIAVDQSVSNPSQASNKIGKLFDFNKT